MADTLPPAITPTLPFALALARRKSEPSRVHHAPHRLRGSSPPTTSLSTLAKLLLPWSCMLPRLPIQSVHNKPPISACNARFLASLLNLRGSSDEADDEEELCGGRAQAGAHLEACDYVVMTTQKTGTPTGWRRVLSICNKNRRSRSEQRLKASGFVPGTDGIGGRVLGQSACSFCLLQFFCSILMMQPCKIWSANSRKTMHSSMIVVLLHRLGLSLLVSNLFCFGFG